MSIAGPIEDHGWPDIPAPVEGCTECDRLTELRTGAQVRRDGTRVTDANVLMRRHQEQTHDSGQADPQELTKEAR